MDNTIDDKVKNVIEPVKFVILCKIWYNIYRFSLY